MKLSVYALSVEAFTISLTALTKILGKAAEHASTKKFDSAVLVGSRLAPDMYPLGKQIQLASDFAKGSAARLAGQDPPRFPDEEKTLDELHARLARTLDYLRSVSPGALEGAEDRIVKIPLPTGAALEFTGVEFLRRWALPNFYFHVVTAYDILRHNGVEIGKRDYLDAALPAPPAAR